MHFYLHVVSKLISTETVSYYIQEIFMSSVLLIIHSWTMYYVFVVLIVTTKDTYIQ